MFMYILEVYYVNTKYCVILKKSYLYLNIET